VRGKLAAESFASLDQLFKTVGMTLMGTMGGASGAVFGTLFRGGAKNLAGQTAFTSESLAMLLMDGLQAVKERGKAKVGDKTMVDALEPAALKAKELAAAPLDESLPAVAEAARQGMEYTKTIVATMGRAKTLGERTIGHPDPGAVSTYLIIHFVAEYVAQSEA
jgi:dihydroxyacetone kinase-like protein